MRFYNDFDPSCINNSQQNKLVAENSDFVCPSTIRSIFLILYYLQIFVGNIPGVIKKKNLCHIDQ